MESIRKSFKSLQRGEKDQLESKPILSDHDDMKSLNNSERKEVILKIDDGAGGEREKSIELGGGGGVGGTEEVKIWRDSSYDFRKDRERETESKGRPIGISNNGVVKEGDGEDEFDFQHWKQQMVEDDPPSKLIGQFLHKQRLSGEMSLDMDLEMDELNEDPGFTLPTISESPTNQQTSPRSLKVSFERCPSSSPETVGRKSKWSDDDNDEGRSGDKVRAEVLRCTSSSNNSSSFKKTSEFFRTKTTKSRLLEVPLDEQQQQQDKKSGRTMRSGQLRSGQMRSGQLRSGQLISAQLRSGQLRSGFLGKSMEEEEDDPFTDGDIPEEFRKAKFSALIVLEWVSLILIVGAFFSSLFIPFFTRKKLWDLPLWKWWLLLLVLICGRLVSGWGIRVLVFFVERNFLLRKRVLYFVYGVRKAVQNCLWLGLGLLAWLLMFDKKVKREVHNEVVPYVSKILVCLLVATALWLVKTLLLKILASSFHVSTYFDRIQEALFNQYVIQTLSGPPLIEIDNANEEEENVMAEVQKLQNAGANIPAELRATALPNMKSGRVVGSGGLERSPRARISFRVSGQVSKQQQPDEGITIDQLHKLNQKNISAWNMKRMMNIVRHGALSTLDERILELTDEEAAAKEEIKSEYEAKCAARKIFSNVAKPGSKYIHLDDLMRFMRHDEALKTMSLFEGANESKRVNKSSLKNWVVNAFRERKALALTLDDTKTAVNQLHRMVNAVVVIVIFVIWLLVLGIATTQLLLFISSQLLLVAFMFGNTCKMVFEAIIFLFVMHPFDVGDRCEIDAVQMVVEEMNILTTVFLRYDNLKIIYPNSVLATKPISNYYRSPDMGDGIDFCVHISTPVEKIALMKQRIIAYIENKPEHWAPAPMVVVRDVEDMNRLKLSVWPSHCMNHQDMGERWVRRALLVEEMIKIFRELDIEYRMLPVDVNIRNMPSLSTGRLPSNWSACTN